MEFEKIDPDVWAKDISIKVALLEDKMNALIEFLKIEMEVTDKKIRITPK